MSGVFGVLDSQRNTQVKALLARMSKAMSHRQWYVVETHSDAKSGVGLGRIGIGIFNQERQPVCNEDESLMVFMSGEFYDTSKIRHELRAKGHSFRDDSDLELVLRLYEEKGAQFIHELEGAFTLAIWDIVNEELIIANDRFGLYPLYYAHYDGKLVFAPEMKGVLCDSNFRKKVDLTALAEYMRFQQLLGDKTFFEGIGLLPPASLLHYVIKTDYLKIDPYWDLSEIPALPTTLSFQAAVEETGQQLSQVVNRMARGAYRIGVYLSGGLDSRTLLGLIDRKYYPVKSITYGQKNCRDVVYAERIAKRVGSDHHWFEFKDGEWIREYANFHLELTEGFHSWIHAHGMSTLAKARSQIDVNFTGWGLDTLMGGYLGDPLLIQARDEQAFVERLFNLLNQKYTWPGIDEAEEKCLYTEKLSHQIVGRAFESLWQEVQKLSGDSNEQRAQCFMTTTHDRRMTHNFVVFKRSHFEVRHPSRDYALFEFCWSLPAEMKQNRQLQRAIISQRLPKLARVPFSKDELLLTDNWPIRTTHALAYKLKRRFNRHIFPLFSERPTLYADYENYLRGELRDWAQAILFDERTLARGIFRPEALRSLMDRHLAGHEQWTIGKIAPIITYEMMLRRLYD